MRRTVPFVLATMAFVLAPADAGLFKKKSGCSASATVTESAKASCAASTTTKSKTKTKSVLQWAGEVATKPFKGKGCKGGVCGVN